jgi:hypothetical protein
MAERVAIASACPRPPRAATAEAYRLPPLTRCEPTAHEVGSLSIQPDGVRGRGSTRLEPAKLERAALRWFARYLDEGKAVSLLKAQLVLSALSELRAAEREAAAKLLAELAQR